MFEFFSLILFKRLQAEYLKNAKVVGEAMLGTRPPPSSSSSSFSSEDESLTTAPPLMLTMNLARVIVSYRIINAINIFTKLLFPIHLMLARGAPAAGSDGRLVEMKYGHKN